MSRLGLAIVILIFGVTAALAGFIIYTILWDSSAINVILPHLKLLLGDIYEIAE
ncbi:hypothetical protein [Acidianus sulfidivorans]|uniref:hypothetical protein n=1 Tax=Acidianus sulfidivorans TaxID=312539 RepID=UPI0013A52CA4|nr:hypothetical protein [Acidianus sulfidivorans]